MLKKFLLIGAALAAGLAHAALEPEPAPGHTPLPPALERLERDVSWPSLAERLSLSEAVLLLESTEGPAWDVYQVHGPVCKPGMLKKECAEAKKQCNAAKKFASKLKAPVSCNGLYPSATVMVTTADVPDEKQERRKFLRSSETTEELPPK